LLQGSILNQANEINEANLNIVMMMDGNNENVRLWIEKYNSKTIQIIDKAAFK
jgi:hypothetical protein